MKTEEIQAIEFIGGCSQLRSYRHIRRYAVPAEAGTLTGVPDPNGGFAAAPEASGLRLGRFCGPDGAQRRRAQVGAERSENARYRRSAGAGRPTGGRESASVPARRSASPRDVGASTALLSRGPSL